jgi:hypothetical protein
MPTVLRIGNFRFHFYSDEGREPAHIHVRRGNTECKFWLDPVSIARNKGFLHMNCVKSKGLFSRTASI